MGKLRTILMAGAAAMMFLTGCEQGPKSVELVYVEWSSEVASTNVVKAVLQEKMGVEADITPVSAAAMWQAVSTGDADGMVAAWLPTTHASYLEETKDQLEVLGPNLQGTRIGLVVPSYVEIDSIPQLAEYADRFDGKIIGIDPGAGIMGKTETAMETYELGESLQLVEGSGATMTAALADAIKNEEWVVVTGWTPHWKFAKWDLKYLADPENVYGGEEYIATVVRSNLEEDMPEVYQFLDNFEWSPDEMQQVMVWNREDDADPYQTAVRWVNENEDKVQSWIPQQ
jgi:glycine betaine/proline transport system substrate-binding protein